MKKDTMVAVRLTAKKRTRFKIKLLESGISAQDFLERAIDDFIERKKVDTEQRKTSDQPF